MKILITGGMGFIGNALCQFFIKDGHTVHSIDNLSNHGWRYYQDQFQVDNFEGDLMDIQLIYLSGFDLVIHTAAKTNVSESIKKHKEYYLTNLGCTKRLVNYCDLLDIPLIFTSTAAVLAKEESQKSPYSESKREAEKFVLEYPLNKVVRLFNIYSSSMPTDNTEGALMGNIISHIKTGKEITMYGDGSKRRDFIYIYDVYQMIKEVIKDRPYQSITHIGSGRSVSIKEIFDACGGPYLKREDRQGEIQESISKEDQLKHKPQIDVIKFIKELRDEKSSDTNAKGI